MAFLDSLIATDNRVADFRAEIATMAASELPRLHYLHSLLPHVPWRFRPDGSTYADIALPGYFSQWDEDPAKAHFGQQRHLLQLGNDGPPARRVPRTGWRPSGTSIGRS